MTEPILPISPLRPSALEALFSKPKPVIGTIHVLPLPGAPAYAGQPMREIIDHAVRDARAYADGGIDGLIVENEGDIPFRKPGDVSHETVAGLTAVAYAVRERVPLPMGINCLANAVKQSLAIAQASGGEFVRANQWTNAYIANEGFVEGAAAEALRYRSMLRAEHVVVFADVNVKHGSHAIVADRPLSELTRDAEAFGADVLIATGNRTGDGTPVSEIEGIRGATARPVLIGSGLTADSAPKLLSIADGVIVGSAMKADGVWWQPVDPDRVSAIMKEVEALR